MVALSNYFLQPAGFLAIGGLLALAVFYLVKKKPDEEVMPSMAFFMERKKEGTLQHAFRQLLHNFMLLLQVLIVIGFAAALAHPYFSQPTTAEKTVVILDNSASMANDIEEAKQFAKNSLGESNTLVVVNEEPRVVLQGAERSITRSTIEDIKTVDTPTDISSALRLAQNYEGQVILASDLDDSYQEIDAAEQLIEADREFKTMDVTPENAWGVTNVEVGQENVSVDVKNFLQNQQEINYKVNEQQKTVSVPGGSVKTVSFDPVEGRNTLRLEEDPLKVDNTAYAYKPLQDNYEAVLISDTGNRYFEKALELIDFVDLEVVNPPVQEKPDADIYIVGNTDRVLSETLGSVENDVRSGNSLIIFGQNGMENFGLESLPVNVKGSWKNSTVDINRPVKTTLKTQIIDAKKTEGSSLTTPKEAMIKSSEGRGEVLLYNIDDHDFRSNFLYPVFWKQVLRELTDRPTIQERNIETGTTLNATNIVTPSGEEKELSAVKKAGFYNTSSGVYAANLLNEDESSEESNNADSSAGLDTEKKDAQNLTVILLLLLMLGEVAYLRYLGEL